ncbi:MAG: DUF6265 family protein [Asticcacaulis sp.]
MKYLWMAGLLVSGSAQAATVSDMAWLTGCWTQARGTRTVTEHWTPADGGMLFGIGRTFSAEKVFTYEFTTLEMRDGVLTFVARPSGQAETAFPLKSLTNGEAVFENTGHDFPQRVIYAQTKDGRLRAAIEGTLKGQTRRIEFDYERCRP